VKVKRRKYTPPEADLIRPAITGNIVALFDVRAHYDRLMRYKLNKHCQGDVLSCAIYAQKPDSVLDGESCNHFEDR
jgi:hypothetical protein